MESKITRERPLTVDSGGKVLEMKPNETQVVYHGEESYLVTRRSVGVWSEPAIRNKNQSITLKHRQRERGSKTPQVVPTVQYQHRLTRRVTLQALKALTHSHKEPINHS